MGSHQGKMRKMGSFPGKRWEIMGTSWENVSGKAVFFFFGGGFFRCDFIGFFGFFSCERRKIDATTMEFEAQKMAKRWDD